MSRGSPQNELFTLSSTICSLFQSMDQIFVDYLFYLLLLVHRVFRRGIESLPQVLWKLWTLFPPCVVDFYQLIAVHCLLKSFLHLLLIFACKFVISKLQELQHRQFLESTFARMKFFTECRVQPSIR